jgi:prolyl 4-hydroxylase
MARMRVHRCRTCGAEFHSRNKLFEHLREDGHDDGHHDFEHLREDGHDDGHHDDVGTCTTSLPSMPVQVPIEVDRACTAVLSAAPSSAPLRLRAVPAPSGGRFARGAPPFVIDHFLTEAECGQLIALSETVGYESAAINVGGTQVFRDEVRRTSRCMIDVPEAAGVIFERLSPFLPSNGPRDGWVRCVGLNERLRFLRYDPGDYFKAHQDGRYERPAGHPRAGDTSLLTLMVYLNTPGKGGETNFLSCGGGRATSVMPTTGLALVFDHDLLHEGAPLLKGCKYCIRTDVMYTRRCE